MSAASRTARPETVNLHPETLKARTPWGPKNPNVCLGFKVYKVSDCWVSGFVFRRFYCFEVSGLGFIRLRLHGLQFLGF